MIAYRSTGPKASRIESFRDALFRGQAPDGGLLLPEAVPALDRPPLRGLQFPGRASAILHAWLEGELAPEIVARLCLRAYDFPVPVVPLEEATFLVELFHGPTAAFKDFGARFLALAMAALREPDQPLTVLVATSGDTGSAVAHAFSDIESARVVLLYPAGGVSPIQELQLTAVPENVMSLRIDGTFDDCQAMVKAMLADARTSARLGLVAANSINVGRLLPQTAYWWHGALDLETAPPPGTAGMPGKHRPAPRAPEPALGVVPSGNLGNLTAGLLAKRQGAPIGRVLAALNRNDVFARFLAHGRLEARTAVATPSNAMDVGNPSNAARVLALYGGDVRALRREVLAESITDEETLDTMRRVHAESGRFVCPHTAVGLAALRRHRERTGDAAPAFVLATAHPAKFPDAVRRATGHELPLPPVLAQLEGSRRAPRDLRPDAAALAAFLHRLG